MMHKIFPLNYATLRIQTMQANGLQGQSLTNDFVLNYRYHHISRNVFAMLKLVVGTACGVISTLKINFIIWLFLKKGVMSVKNNKLLKIELFKIHYLDILPWVLKHFYAQ